MHFLCFLLVRHSSLDIHTAQFSFSLFVWFFIFSTRSQICGITNESRFVWFLERDARLNVVFFVIFSFAKRLKKSERKIKGWNGQSWCRTVLAPQELVPLMSGNRAPFVRIKSRNWLETKVSEIISCEESKNFLWICKYVPLMVFT